MSEEPSPFAAGGEVAAPALKTGGGGEAAGGLSDENKPKEKEKKKKKEKEESKDPKKIAKKAARLAAEAEATRIAEEEAAAAAAIEEARIKAEEEAARPKTPEPDPTIKLTLLPIDSGWIMGDPLHVEVLLDSNVFNLRSLIHAKKGISPNRIFIRDKNLKTLSMVQEKNTFRRLALPDGYTWTIEPSNPQAWLWHPSEWYINKYIKDIHNVISASIEKIVSVEELIAKIIIPLHWRDKTIVTFCRMYPEHFHVHVDTNRSHYYIAKPPKHSPFTLGTYADLPALLGKYVHYQVPYFDWEAYADINDTKRLELDFAIPDMAYEITILAAKDIMRADTFGSSDPFCIVYFFNGENYRKLGQTNARRNTLNPIWVDQRFPLSINASFEVEQCRLLIEMWDCDIGPHGNNIQGEFLGALELSGAKLQQFIADGETHINTYDLEQREESWPDQDQSGVKGQIVVKGGKAGYEVNVVNCSNLITPANKFSKPFVIIIFNDEEMDSTMPEQRNIQNPIYQHIINLAFSEMSRKLVDCELEFQVWCTVGKGAGIVNEDAKGDFLGSIFFTGDDLVNFIRGNVPYATLERRLLRQSKNIPLRQRKNPVQGYMTVIGGPAGLPMQPGKKIEITIDWADKISKVVRAYIHIEWNYMRVATTELFPVVIGQARINQSFTFETSAGSDNCLTSALRLDMWEDSAAAVGSEGAQYMGMIAITAEDLSELCDNKYACVKTYEWQLDPNRDARGQRMVRGNVTIRAGCPKDRMKDERVIVVHACKNLGLANAGATFGLGSSDPYVEIKFNGEVVGRTPTEELNLNPVWEAQYFFIKIPPLRELSDKELKAWVAKNDELLAKGEKAIERTLYHESVLQIAVYDENNSGGEGTCLGCVIFEEHDLVTFFDVANAHQTWFPLVKDGRGMYAPYADSKTRGPTLGTDSQIRLGTPALEYSSPVTWELAVEAALEAENARLREIEEERVAIEMQKLEAAAAAEEKIARELVEAEEAEKKRIAEEERIREEKYLNGELEDEESEVPEAIVEELSEEEKAIKAQQEAKIKADKEAYDDMMALSLDDD